MHDQMQRDSRHSSQFLLCFDLFIYDFYDITNMNFVS